MANKIIVIFNPCEKHRFLLRNLMSKIDRYLSQKSDNNFNEKSSYYLTNFLFQFYIATGQFCKEVLRFFVVILLLILFDIIFKFVH
jgi:hypothetical protein